ncbi:MAG: hypothetical protein K2F55_00265, partial [Erysipelotrichaceae bacterium]|nr:hypothetical protein [Erysipelotrichaceae bacterium]
DNVKTAQNGNRHPYIYGGGYRNHTTGDHAQITIINANSETRFAGIYAGTKYSDYDGNVRMDIDERVIIERQGETGAIMEEAGIYASGLKGRLPHGTTTYDYNVNGQVDIVIRGNRFGNSITEINCNTGGTTPKANVELIGVNAANGRLKLYDANNMLLNNTTLKLAPEADMGITGNLTLLEQSILDLSNKTNSYVGGNLIGSNDANTASILELKKDGKMTISGTVTGSTYFITPPIAGAINKNDPISGLVDTGRTYIESNADATGEFLFKPYTSVDEIHKSLVKEQVDGKTTWTIRKEEHEFKSTEISGPKKVTVDDVMQENEDLAVRFMIKTIDTNDQPFAMDIYARVLDANGNVFNDLEAAYYSFNENTFVQEFMLYPLQATVPTGQYKLQILDGPENTVKNAPNVIGEYDFEITATLVGDVTIAGNAEVGETLTANVANLPQGVDEQDLTYQWYVNGVAVQGATSKTWTVDGNANDTVYVEVGHANYANKLQSSTTTITNANQLTGTIQIEGTPRAGEVLTANVTGLPQGVNEQDLTYQWYVNGAAVQGATAKTWTVEANVDDKVTVKVAHANYRNELTSAEVTVVDKDPITGTVSISGTPRAGETLTADVTGLPQGVNEQDLTYQWYVNGTAVQGATTKTWTVAANIGDKVTVKVSHANYKDELTSAEVTVVDKDALTGTVTITGTPKVGETLTAEVTGLPNDANTTIKWYANGVEVATGETWTTTYDYVDQEITVKVTADNYTGELESTAVTLMKADLTGTVTITGTAKVGETLTAEVTGLPNDANTTIKWYANGVEIATGETWTTTYDYVDQEITVKVTADNYTGELTSAAVTLMKADLTGTVTITGTAKVGETLT